jgi:hypothetical protein
MNTRVVAFEEVSPATVQRRSIWTTVLSCLLIVHAALLISEVLTGPGWLAWVECIVASLFGLVGLRERASEAEPRSLSNPPKTSQPSWLRRHPCRVDQSEASRR